MRTIDELIEALTYPITLDDQFIMLFEDDAEDIIYYLKKYKETL